jgi:hypothetical protein
VWVTVVPDVFRSEDRSALRVALEDIASPKDRYGWSSAGVYSFWDPETRDVLYIGLAVDLPNRLAQHFGLGSSAERGTKLANVNAWFDEHDTLGYSVLLQTSNTQPISSRNAALKSELRGLVFDNVFDPDGDELAVLEGRLIEQHRLSRGSRPPWNSIGGSKMGARRAQRNRWSNDPTIFDVLTGTVDSWLTSRKTIRQLSGDPTACTFEEWLHAPRILAAGLGRAMTRDEFSSMAFGLEASAFDVSDTRSRISEQGWLGLPHPCPPADPFVPAFMWTGGFHFASVLSEILSEHQRGEESPWSSAAAPN